MAAPGPETARYGGNTSCVQVTGDDGTILILDAGTGIRRLGAALGAVAPELERAGAELKTLAVSIASHSPLMDPILDEFERKLGVKSGETTADDRFTLLTTSCLGICAVGPVVVIDDDVYGNVEPDQVAGILARYE